MTHWPASRVVAGFLVLTVSTAIFKASHSAGAAEVITAAPKRPFTVFWDAPHEGSHVEVDLYYCGESCREEDDCGYWIQPLCEHASRNGEDAANDCRYVEGQGYEITLPEPAAGESGGYKMSFVHADDLYSFTCLQAFNLLGASHGVAGELMKEKKRATGGVKTHQTFLEVTLPSKGSVVDAGHMVAVKFGYNSEMKSTLRSITMDLHMSDGTGDCGTWVTSLDDGISDCGGKVCFSNVRIPWATKSGFYSIRVRPLESSGDIFACSGAFEVETSPMNGLVSSMALRLELSTAFREKSTSSFPSTHLSTSSDSYQFSFRRERPSQGEAGRGSSPPGVAQTNGGNIAGGGNGAVEEAILANNAVKDGGAIPESNIVNGYVGLLDESASFDQNGSRLTDGSLRYIPSFASNKVDGSGSRSGSAASPDALSEATNDKGEGHHSIPDRVGAFPASDSPTHDWLKEYIAFLSARKSVATPPSDDETRSNKHLGTEGSKAMAGANERSSDYTTVQLAQSVAAGVSATPDRTVTPGYDDSGSFFTPSFFSLHSGYPTLSVVEDNVDLPVKYFANIRVTESIDSDVSKHEPSLGSSGRDTSATRDGGTSEHAAHDREGTSDVGLEVNIATVEHGPNTGASSSESASSELETGGLVADSVKSPQSSPIWSGFATGTETGWNLDGSQDSKYSWVDDDGHPLGTERLDDDNVEKDHNILGEEVLSTSRIQVA